MIIRTTPNPFVHVLPSFGKKALIALTWLALAGVASAQHSIGLKLGINGNGNQQSAAVGALLPGDLAGAGGYEQTNWNVLGRWGDNATNAFGTNAYVIIDSGGDDTHVTINWDASGSWSVVNGGAPVDQGDPNKNLMNAYDDSNGNGNVALTNGMNLYGQNNNNKPMVYLTGIQAWLATEGASQYDLVLYMDGDNQAGRTGEFWIQNVSGAFPSLTYGTDLTTHVFLRDFNNFPANPTYQRVPFTSNNGRVAGAGNYTVFTGLSADSVLVRSAEFNTRSGINAIQLVPRTAVIGATLNPLLPANTYSGSRASFRATVAGVQPFAYQWQKDGVNLTDVGNISGSTAVTLNIANASGADVGSYSVIVSNAGGFSTSTIVPLTVTAPVAGSYAEKVATNSAVAYWRLNETGDPSTNFTAAYDLIGGFNGVYGPLAQNGYNGIVGPQPPDFPGFESGNSALRTTLSTVTPLPYPSTYVSWVVAPPLNLNTNTVTICAWIYPIGNQAASSALVFERGGDVSGFGFGTAANNANSLGYTWNGAGNTFGFGSGLIPASNQWSFVALVVSPTNAIIYLYNTNGQFSATNTVTHANGAWAAATMIGDDPSSTGTPQNRAFNGAIDEVAVFNRCLTDQDLYLYYKKGLNVGIIPATISIQPLSQALFAGRTARFSVTGAGDKPLNYQWRSNTVNLVSGGRLSGATTANLVISNLDVADSASYDVVVDNIAHVPIVSSPATLTVIASNATPVAYEGTLRSLNPTHYWRFNEAAASPYAYDYWNGNIATNENVTTGVSGPQPSDFAGFESTNAANAYDGFITDTDTQQSFINNLAQFSIIGWFNSAGIQAARIGLFGQNDSAEFGFHAADASGQAQLGIWTPNGGSAMLPQTLITPGQWYFAAGIGDGTNITLYLFTTNGSGGFVANQSVAAGATTNYGASAYSFKIGGGGVLDATGNYFTGLIDEVATFNRALSSGELASLFAAGLGVSGLAPQITAQPASTTLYAGRTATFNVTAVGSSPLSYQWRRNGTPLSDGGNISGASSRSLVITNVASANAGDYDVIVANASGSATSTLATLGVITPASGGYEAAATALNPIAYYRLNSTNDPAAGNVLNPDYWGGHGGVYGVGSQNGFNNVMGPVPPDFTFEANNYALATFPNVASSWATAPIGSLSTNRVTFTMWIQPTGTFDVFAGLLVNRNSGVAGGFGYTGGQIGYTWNNNNANTYNFRSGFVPPLSNWTFVACVIYPTQAVIYASQSTPPYGLQAATNVLAHTADVFGNNWQVGSDDSSANNNGSRTFNGLIDEVAVYNYSLNLAQLTQLYSAGGGLVPVTLTIQRSGANVILTWPTGTLLEADDINGPWVTNNATSPYTYNPATPAQKFYKVQIR